jgi:Lipocalin-like domain
MSATPLAGTWMLESYELRHPDGSLERPLGDEPLGLLIYGADGSVSAQLASADETGADSIAYSGTYEVDSAMASVTHHVVVSTDPAWTGRSLRRALLMDGERLVLSASVRGADAAMDEHELAWRRT